MNAGDQRTQVKSDESRKDDDAPEKPLIESVKGDVVERLQVEEAEEAKLTPEETKPTNEEKPAAVADDDEGLNADVMKKLQVVEAEEPRVTPEVAKPKTEEAVADLEKPVAQESHNAMSDVAEKPLVEQPEGAKPLAEEVKPLAEAPKGACAEAKPAASKKLHRIVLICFDDSEHSRRAVQFYVRGLSRPSDHVVMMHAIEAQEIIIPSQPIYVTPITSATFHEDLKRMKSKITAKGVELQALLKAAGLKSRIYVMDGPDKPGVYIVQKAADLDANLIVIGSRGLGVIRRTFMGSVSDYVLHHAGCPTCVVPPTHRR